MITPYISGWDQPNLVHQDRQLACPVVCSAARFQRYNAAGLSCGELQDLTPREPATERLPSTRIGAERLKDILRNI